MLKELGKYADWLFYASLVGVVFAAYGAFAGAESDLWLAPTQWVMVSAGMVVYATYLKLSK
jgi:hypothetical protein